MAKVDSAPAPTDPDDDAKPLLLSELSDKTQELFKSKLRAELKKIAALAPLEFPEEVECQPPALDLPADAETISKRIHDTVTDLLDDYSDAWLKQIEEALDAKFTEEACKRKDTWMQTFLCRTMRQAWLVRALTTVDEIAATKLFTKPVKLPVSKVEWAHLEDSCEEAMELLTTELDESSSEEEEDPSGDESLLSGSDEDGSGSDEGGSGSGSDDSDDDKSDISCDDIEDMKAEAKAIGIKRKKKRKREEQPDDDEAKENAAAPQSDAD